MNKVLLAALRAFKRGNFDVRLREDLTGLDGQIVETFNELVSMVKAIRDYQAKAGFPRDRTKAVAKAQATKAAKAKAKK